MNHGSTKRHPTAADSHDHAAWLDESPGVRQKAGVRSWRGLAILRTMIHGSAKRRAVRCRSRRRNLRLLREQQAHVLEHVLRMRAEPESHVRVAQHHLALRVEHDRDALWMLAVLRFGGAERERERLVGVGPDLVRKLLLLRPREVLLGRVEARADDGDAEVLELLVAVAEPATFDRSTAGRGRWVEPHHGRVAEKRLLGARPPILIERPELRRLDGRRRTLAVERRGVRHCRDARGARENDQGNHA